MVRQVETEANQAILMRDQNPLYLTALNALNHRGKALAPEVHAASSFLNPFINGDSASAAVVLHRLNLRGQVVALPRATDAAIHDGKALLRRAAQHRPNVGPVKYRCPDGRRLAVSLPSRSQRRTVLVARPMRLANSLIR
jgi:hypothetical protein